MNLVAAAMTSAVLHCSRSLSGCRRRLIGFVLVIAYKYGTCLVEMDADDDDGVDDAVVKDIRMYFNHELCPNDGVPGKLCRTIMPPPAFVIIIP